MCLHEGIYEFIIQDRRGDHGDGILDPGYYSLMSNGVEIKRGGGNNGFKDEEKTDFSIPLLVAGTSTHAVTSGSPTTTPTLPAGNSPVARDDTATVLSGDFIFVALFLLMIHPRLGRYLVLGVLHLPAHRMKIVLSDWICWR